MKIHYLRMENYRQYRDARLEFSTDPGKNFTIIQGSNGAGKTTLLNAITWCLYGEEKHLSKADSKKMPIANEKLCTEMKIGQTNGVKVEIGLGRDEVMYMISRSAQVHKRLDGEINVATDTDPTVLFLSRSDWKTSPQPNFAIKSLLPENISQFFLFDGEQLDQFFQRDSAERVKRGIVDVSQIDLLDTAYKHLNRVTVEIMRNSIGVGEEAERQKKIFDEAERELQACQSRLETLHNNLKGVEANIEAINEKLRESPEEEVRKLQESREILNGQVNDCETKLVELIEKAASKLRETGPVIYAYSAITNALNEIQGKVRHDELPPKVRRPFFRDLLNQGTCICGTPLDENSEAKKNVQERMEALETEHFMNEASTGRFQLDYILNALPKRIEEQQNIGREIWQFEEAIREAKQGLREISQKIENYGEINLEEIKLLEQQLKQYQTKQTEINRDIGAEGEKHRTAKKKREAAFRDYQKAIELDRKQKDVLIRSEICSQALAVLEQIRMELLAETREKIQQKTEEYFLRLIWKKATYKSVKIDENYRLNVENIRGIPSLGTLSAGERQILALAFTAALGTISGFDAPIVIDTPTGRISGEPRKNIAEALPNYLQDTQVTFLMTDTEYTDSVRVRLAHQVGKEYDLDFDEAESITKVIERRG